MSKINSIIIDKNQLIDRTQVPFLDDRLGFKFPILDHGFIRIVDYMGDDNSIDEAARLSYGVGTKRKEEARGLINYLMNHRHTSPFEMCELKIHVKLPIFVMRQWVRQRTASLNEYSARYSILSNEFYSPELNDIQYQSTTNKQGRNIIMEPDQAQSVKNMIDLNSKQTYSLYELLIDDNIDLARELARMCLSVNAYTEMYWKIDLHNLLNFLFNRTDLHAQKEIRVYADFLEQIVAQWVPYTFNAYENYRKNAITFSAYESEIIKWAIIQKNLNPEEKPTFADKLSKREWEAFVKKINQIN